MKGVKAEVDYQDDPACKNFVCQINDHIFRNDVKRGSDHSFSLLLPLSIFKTCKNTIALLNLRALPYLEIFKDRLSSLLGEQNIIILVELMEKNQFRN